MKVTLKEFENIPGSELKPGEIYYNPDLQDYFWYVKYGESNLLVSVSTSKVLLLDRYQMFAEVVVELILCHKQPLQKSSLFIC